MFKKTIVISVLLLIIMFCSFCNGIKIAEITDTTPVCVGNSQFIKCVSGKIYWGDTDGLFCCKKDDFKKIYGIKDIIDTDERIEVYITASTWKNLFYIRIINDEYYEFCIYDFINEKNEVVYKSISDAKRKHEYLGINKTHIKGINEKEQNLDDIPSKFFIYNNKVYYQLGSSIIMPGSISILDKIIVNDVDTYSPLYLFDNTIVYMSTGKQIIECNCDNKEKSMVLDEQCKYMFEDNNVLYIQLLDGRIVKKEKDGKLKEVACIDGDLLEIESNKLLFVDYKNENYVIEDIDTKSIIKKVSKRIDDIGALLLGDNLIVGGYDTNRNEPYVTIKN